MESVKQVPKCLGREQTLERLGRLEEDWGTVTVVSSVVVVVLVKTVTDFCF